MQMIFQETDLRDYSDDRGSKMEKQNIITNYTACLRVAEVIMEAENMAVNQATKTRIANAIYLKLK